MNKKHYRVINDVACLLYFPPVPALYACSLTGFPIKINSRRWGIFSGREAIMPISFLSRIILFSSDKFTILGRYLQSWLSSMPVRLLLARDSVWTYEKVRQGNNSNSRRYTSGLSWLASLNITAASFGLPPKPGGLRLCFLTTSSWSID